jgi:thermospermine synthase
MGGAEGSAAREVLRHKTVQRVVMCDIDQVHVQTLNRIRGHADMFTVYFRITWRMHDQEVVNFCRTYLTMNRQAFCSEKLCLIINDARCIGQVSQQFVLSLA